MEVTLSRSNFSQNETVNKFEFCHAVNQILSILLISVHKYIRRNNLAKCKLNIKMGIMVINDPGMLLKN